MRRYLSLKKCYTDNLVALSLEGNRRLAALKYLHAARHGEEVPRKWKDLVQNTQVSEEHFKKLFNKIPYIRVDSREEVESFLGFRHATGIKQWRTEQKAQYIAKLIEQGMSYEEVMRTNRKQNPHGSTALYFL